jgi:hypothetical protein
MASKMLDSTFGVSKTTFLARIVPANETDAFNDDRCSFCWSPYDSDHPGVRISPCNHVFGQNCLVEMTNRPNGDHCPICRTLIFRPTLFSTLGQWFVDFFARMDYQLDLGYHNLSLIYHSIFSYVPPRPRMCIEGLWCVWWNFNYPFSYALLLINFTDVLDRNPNLDIGFEMRMHTFNTFMLGQMAKYSPVREVGALEIGLYTAWSAAVICFVDHVNGRSLKNKGDLGVYVVIVGLGLGAHFAVTILFWCVCATHFDGWGVI